MLVIFLFIMPSLVPESIDTLIEQFSPPSTTQKFVHFFDELLNTTELSSGQMTTRIVLWLSSTIIVLLLFWLHIPRATQRAQALAHVHEQQADQLRNTDPKQSLLLYHSALNLTLNAALENSLKTKIEKTRTSPPAHTEIHQQTTTDHTATVFVTPDANTESRSLVASRYRIDAPPRPGSNGTGTSRPRHRAGPGYRTQAARALVNTGRTIC